jgi:hypothetical protein
MLEKLIKKSKKVVEEMDLPKDLKGKSDYAMKAMSPKKPSKDKEIEIEIELMLDSAKKKKK